MPGLTSTDQASIVSLISSILRLKSHSKVSGTREQDLADLSASIIEFCDKLLGVRCQGEDMAIAKLLEAYKEQTLSEIREIDSSKKLGDLMHAGVESWGRLPIHQEIFNAIQLRNSILKERERVIRMTIDERDQYIKSSSYDYYGNAVLRYGSSDLPPEERARYLRDAEKLSYSSQCSWATEHQELVKRFIESNPFFDLNQAINLQWLSAQSLLCSNYLRHRNQLTNVEYSYYVEKHSQIREKLVKEYKYVVSNLEKLPIDTQRIKLCELFGELNKQIEAEYTNINAYSVSEHLLALEACKCVLSEARQKLQTKPVVVAFEQLVTTFSCVTVENLGPCQAQNAGLYGAKFKV